MNLRHTLLATALSTALMFSNGAGAFAQGGGDSGQAISNMTRGELENFIKNYIISHPEVIVQTLVISEQQSKAHNIQQTKMGIQTHQAELYQDAASPYIGNPKGDVTIVEFFDYNCGYCKTLAPVMGELVKADPNVKVVFKEYPILAPESETAAKASIAFFHLAPEKYLDFHLGMMQNGGGKDLSVALEIAGKLGVDANTLKAEMEKPYVAEQLESTKMLGGALYIDGTPSTIIGEEVMIGQLDVPTLQSKVAALRGKK